MSNQNQSDILDVEKGKFIKKLQKGFGRYKGKLPFKCFNCGRIRHFTNKCPYPKQEDSDDEEIQNHEEHKKGKTRNKKKHYKQKKDHCTKEDNNSSKECEDGDSELLFMGMDTQNNDVDDE